MKDSTAYCGLDCSKCGAYISKMTGDYELRKKTAAEWSSPEWKVTPEEVSCDGCKAEGGELFKHCANCAVRACASERGYATCAHCKDYGCEKITSMLNILDDYARSTLESIRASLN
jgi:hypothetical protein